MDEMVADEGSQSPLLRRRGSATRVAAVAVVLLLQGALFATRSRSGVPAAAPALAAGVSMEVSWEALPSEKQVSYEDALSGCAADATSTFDYEAICPTLDNYMWCSRMAAAVPGDGTVDASLCPDDDAVCREMATSPCAVSCADPQTAWWEACSWQALGRFDEYCAGTFVPDAPEGLASGGDPENLKLGGETLVDEGLDGCDEHAFCLACTSSESTAANCASLLEITSGAVVGAIAGVWSDGFEHGGTAATAIILNPGAYCGASGSK